MIQNCWCTKLLNTVVCGMVVHEELGSGFHSQISLSQKDDKFYIECLSVSEKENVKIKMPIEYCPFCGKKMEINNETKQRLTYEHNIDGISDVGLYDSGKQGINDAVVKLCDYENTGFTPKQIEEMKLKLKDLEGIIRMCLDKIGLQGDYFKD